VVSHQTLRKHMGGVCEQRVEDWDLRQKREQDDGETWLMTELLILLCNNSYYYVKVTKYNFLELGATKGL
jgi:hypothetical protein